MSALTTVQKGLQKNLEKSLAVMGDEIKKALPKIMSRDRFARVVMTAVAKTPKLLECDQRSLLGSILTAAQIGLEPNGPDGKCYLIPFKGQATLQIGYRGMLDLVRRSGEIIGIHAELVYEEDEFEIVLGLDPIIVHRPKFFGDRGNVVLAYSVAKFRDGSSDFIWMSMDELEKVRQSSMAKNSGPWVDWPEEMMKKTVLKRHCKTLPTSIESSHALAVDETAKGDIQVDMMTPQVGETLLEIDAAEEAALESLDASQNDKKVFFDWCSSKGVSQFLTLQEKTEVNSACSKDRLGELMREAKGRSAEAKNAATEDPVQTEDGIDTEPF